MASIFFTVRVLIGLFKECLVAIECISIKFYTVRILVGQIRLDRLVDKWSGSIEVGITTHNPSILDFPATMTNMRSRNGNSKHLSFSDKSHLNLNFYFLVEHSCVYQISGDATLGE